MALKLTILCENSVGRPGHLIGEHGFACLIETGTGTWLFDTGSGLGLVNNAAELGKDLKTLNGIILSHGHYDHTGGLRQVLEHRNAATPIFAHPEIFQPRYWKSAFEKRTIGLPFTRQELEAYGARFELASGPVRLTEQILLSGEVPRRTNFEAEDPHLVIEPEPGVYQPDPLRDDLSVVLTTGKGLVIVLGCAHAGIINILDHFIALSGEERIRAVIGGTHLGPAPESQYLASLAALKRYRIDKIATAHCTGLARAAQLSQEFCGRFLFAATGSVLEFD